MQKKIQKVKKVLMKNNIYIPLTVGIILAVLLYFYSDKIRRFITNTTGNEMFISPPETQSITTAIENLKENE